MHSVLLLVVNCTVGIEDKKVLFCFHLSPHGVFALTLRCDDMNCSETPVLCTWLETFLFIKMSWLLLCLLFFIYICLYVELYFMYLYLLKESINVCQLGFESLSLYFIMSSHCYCCGDINVMIVPLIQASLWVLQSGEKNFFNHNVFFNAFGWQYELTQDILLDERCCEGLY